MGLNMKRFVLAGRSVEVQNDENQLMFLYTYGLCDRVTFCFETTQKASPYTNCLYN